MADRCRPQDCAATLYDEEHLLSQSSLLDDDVARSEDNLSQRNTVRTTTAGEERQEKLGRTDVRLEW